MANISVLHANKSHKNFLIRLLNAEFDINKNYIYSLKTDTIPARDDKNVIDLIDKTIESLNL